MGDDPGRTSPTALQAHDAELLLPLSRFVRTLDGPGDQLSDLGQGIGRIDGSGDRHTFEGFLDNAEPVDPVPEIGLVDLLAIELDGLDVGEGADQGDRTPGEEREDRDDPLVLHVENVSGIRVEQHHQEKGGGQAETAHDEQGGEGEAGISEGYPPRDQQDEQVDAKQRLENPFHPVGIGLERNEILAFGRPSL